MILRTELRRSTAPVVGIGLLLVSVALLYGLPGPWGKRTAPWDEQWTGLAQWTRYLSVFVLPLVLGAGAWQGSRDKRSGVPELFATTPKAPWRRVLPTAVAVGIMLTAGYVALLIVGGVQVAGTANYFHLKWLPVAGVMVLALVGAALLGAGLGRLVPSPVTAPVLAVAGLAAQASVLQTGWPKLLTPVFDSPDITVLTTVAVTVTLTQALWFLGIGATGFGLLVAARTRTRVIALLPVVVSAAVAVPVLANVDSPVVADPGARALVCDDRGPKVCVTQAHADFLPTLTGPAREALALMEKLPSPPTSVVELAPNENASTPAGATPVSFPMSLPTDPAKIRLAVLTGGAPTCGSTDYEVIGQIGAAQTIIVMWLMGGQAPVADFQDAWAISKSEINRLWQEFQALPPAEQPARVAELREAAVFCRGEVDMP
jgi:hypothetical protein